MLDDMVILGAAVDGTEDVEGSTEEAELAGAPALLSDVAEVERVRDEVVEAVTWLCGGPGELP